VRSTSETVVKWKLLHCAAYFGHTEAAAGLLDRRAHIETATSFGYTALHHASRNDQLDVVQVLLARRARIQAKTKREESTPLHHAAIQGHAGITEALLRSKAQTHAVDSGHATSLHSASRAGHVECATLLLDYRADGRAKDKYGQTALHLAANTNQVAVARLILDRFPETLLMRCSKSRSAFDVARFKEHDEVAAMLRGEEKPGARKNEDSLEQPNILTTSLEIAIQGGAAAASAEKEAKEVDLSHMI
jgi:ankyrin repeat protein